MSSADSDMLGAGSIFSNDIYKVYINRNASDRQLLRVTQYTMIVIGVLSMLVALSNTQSIIAVLMFSFSLRAGGFFFPYILGHYWKKASWAGAMCSIILGSVIVVLVEHNIIPSFGLESIFPGLLISFIVFVLFSNIFPSKRYTEEISEKT